LDALVSFEVIEQGVIMRDNEFVKNKVTYHRHRDFPSEFVVSRNIDVWCPPGYLENSAQRYPVIYMQDGQNLFDPAVAYGGITWGVAETLTRLINEQFVGAIVVGIWNSEAGGNLKPIL
jgi:enterochelin esterase-like enzyme